MIFYTLVFRKCFPLNKYISVNQNLYLETYYRPTLSQVESILDKEMMCIIAVLKIELSMSQEKIASEYVDRSFKNPFDEFSLGLTKFHELSCLIFFFAR